MFRNTTYGLFRYNGETTEQIHTYRSRRKARKGIKHYAGRHAILGWRIELVSRDELKVHVCNQASWTYTIHKIKEA